MQRNNDARSGAPPILENLKHESAARESKIPLPDGARRIVKEDGREVILVRKRKRRSHQPKKEKEKRNKKIRVFALFAILALLILFGIAVTVMIGYFNGEKYKAKLEESAKKLTGADVKITEVSLSPFSARIKNIKFDWTKQGAVLSSMDVNGVKFEYPVSSFISAKWNGKSAIASDGQLRLGLSKNITSLNTSGESNPEISFVRFIIQETDIHFGDREHWGVRDVRTVFEPSADGKHILHADGGLFKTPLKTVFNFKSGLVEVSETAPTHLNLTLQPKDDTKGELNLEGNINMVFGKDHTFELGMKDLELRTWQYPLGVKFLRGVVSEGVGNLHYRLGDDNSIVFDVKANFAHCTVSAWPFVATLANELNTSYYMRPDFRTKAVARIKSTSEGVEVTDIDFEEEYRMGIKGSYRINNLQEIEGTLEVGVPYEGMQADELKVYRRVFKKDDGMMMWATLNLSGTLSQPVDDLAEKLRMARSVSQGNETLPKQNADDMFENMNK